MGWKINVSFRRSRVHGRGVFACETIEAGTRIWEYDRSMPLFDRTSIRQMDAKTLHLALLGGYLHCPSQRFLWYTDGMQFMNHAPVGRANVGLGYWPAQLESDHIVALRDIQPGEELLENYGMCLSGGLNPDHWLRPYYLSFCPQHYAFLLDIKHSAQVEPQLVLQEAGMKRRKVAPSASSITGLESTASKPEVRQAA